ncbi:MAG: exonuclease domain-containing protein [Lachnospiraceae bacterium]|nr:exonuclease domain-containing protein [Lachnospiraceae bacterium]
MNYIVLDLEWNQASKPEDSDPAMPFEIVEIGALKLGSDRNMISEFSRLVKPQVYTTMHSITGNLIHLQMQQLQSGDPFPAVYEDFKNWCGDEPFFCTWGPLDLTELQRNMRHFDIKPLANGPIAFLDVQKLFSIAFDFKERRNLEFAIDHLGIEKDIPFHRAFSDAYYTALILERIPRDVLSHCSYDVFHLPKDKEHEIHTVFDDHYKYISRPFESRERALSDKEVMSSKCYLCGENTKKYVKWFTTNNRHFLGVSECPVHGLMKSKIRLRKAEDGSLYIVKTQKFIDKKTADSLKYKREHAVKEHGPDASL